MHKPASKLKCAFGVLNAACEFAVAICMKHHKVCVVGIQASLGLVIFTTNEEE
jgi:hypothetical protein